MTKQWQNKEKEDAKIFGNKQTPRSGGLWFAKGDSKGSRFLIENKTSSKQSYSITSNVWEKINREALLEGKIPLLSIEFGEAKHNLVVLDLNDFLTLIPKGEI